MSDVGFLVEVVCDHDGRGCEAPPRVVCRAVWVTYRGEDDHRKPRWLALEDPGYPPARQTYFGELRRLLAGLPPEVEGAVLANPSARDRYVKGDMAGVRWRFWCADCDDTLPKTASRVEPFFDALRQRGVARVTLQQIRAILN